jgi:flagellar protein FlbD
VRKLLTALGYRKTPRNAGEVVRLPRAVGSPSRNPETAHAPFSVEEDHRMIKLHHGRDQRPIWVNPDLMESVEATPDTVIKLTTDRKMIVHETPEEIVGLVVEYRRRTSRPHVIPSS